MKAKLKLWTGWDSVRRLVRNILPVTIAVLSWAGIVIAFIVCGTLLVAMLIPMSPFVAIALAWEFWRKPVASWWGEQFEKGCKIIIPNNAITQPHEE
jgi:hypothetical protein